MKRLVKSRQTDKHCWDCNSLLVSNTLRKVNGNMHYCYPKCTDKKIINDRVEGLLFYRLLTNKVK